MFLYTVGLLQEHIGPDVLKMSFVYFRTHNILHKVRFSRSTALQYGGERVLLNKEHTSTPNSLSNFGVPLDPVIAFSSIGDFEIEKIFVKKKIKTLVNLANLSK